MELKTLLYHIEDGIAVITLNRPHRGNAWTGRMNTEYRWVLAQAEQDASVRVIIVTGAGRAFCVGADSKALEGHVEKGGYDDGVKEPLATPGFGVHPALDRQWASQFGVGKPIIAAINGPAAGVGLVLACYCDLRFAAAGVKLTTAHGKLNLPPEFGLSWLLPRMIGLTRANDLLLTSRIFMSEEAESMGLVNRVLPPEELLPHVLEYASEMARNVSRHSLQSSKQQIYIDLHREVSDSLDNSQILLEQMMQEDDYIKGVKALQEKRSPDFN